MEGLHRRLQEEAHDTRRRRVSATVSPACPAERIRPDSALRAMRLEQRTPSLRLQAACSNPAPRPLRHRTPTRSPPSRRRGGSGFLEQQPASTSWPVRRARRAACIGSAPSRRSKSPCSPSASPLRGRTPHGAASARRFGICNELQQRLGWHRCARSANRGPRACPRSAPSPCGPPISVLPSAPATEPTALLLLPRTA